jgi:hypothetical protein
MLIDILDAYVPIIRWTGLTVLVFFWLVISFAKPGRGRTVCEWLAAVGLYVTVMSFVLHGMYLALHMDSAAARIPAVIGLSILTFLFCVGAVVSLGHLVAGLRSSGKVVADATH